MVDNCKANNEVIEAKENPKLKEIVTEESKTHNSPQKDQMRQG